METFLFVLCTGAFCRRGTRVAERYVYDNAILQSVGKIVKIRRSILYDADACIRREPLKRLEHDDLLGCTRESAVAEDGA